MYKMICDVMPMLNTLPSMFNNQSACLTDAKYGQTSSCYDFATISLLTNSEMRGRV